jgi:cytoskeletal protein RodZ
VSNNSTSKNSGKNGSKTSWGSVILPDMQASDWQRIGEALKQSREANQKDLGLVAQQLCLSTNQVKALELGTGKVFHGDRIRFACARRYATSLGLDWTALLDRCGLKAPEPEVAAAVEEMATPTAASPEPSAQSSDAPAPQAEIAAVANAAQDGTTHRCPMLALICLAGLALAAMLLGYWNTPAPAAPESITMIQQPLPRPSESSTASDNEQSLSTAQSTAAATAEELPIIDLIGSDANKRADSFYLNPRANLTLFKRKYSDKGEGQRLDISRGAETRVALASDEVVRFATGTQANDVGLFYQGRTAPPTLIESGHWIRFVGRQP